MKRLLQKFILRECTPQEIEQVVLFFQNSKKSDVEALPEGEEVLQMLGEKRFMAEDSADRIYRNITAHSRADNSGIFPIRRSVRRFAAAAVLVGLICSCFFLRESLVIETTPIETSGGYVTIELENGQETILNKTDSLQIADSKGNVLGVQKGTTLVYAPKEEITSLRYNTINVPYGKRFELSLSDGTRVFLNAGTSLKFPIGFIKGKQREVFLTGEAFFEVAEDKEHPFIVNTGELSVEVLGTEFNVEAYSGSDLQKVVLVEGSVNVNNSKGEHLLMQPDQMISSRGGNMQKSTVSAADIASWKDGYFTLREASAAETISLLERYYHIKIHSRGKDDLDEIVGTGKVYLSDDVANVITTLSLLTKNQYSFDHLSSTEQKLIQ